jgi:hypothetical protein
MRLQCGGPQTDRFRFSIEPGEDHPLAGSDRLACGNITASIVTLVVLWQLDLNGESSRSLVDLVLCFDPRRAGRLGGCKRARGALPTEAERLSDLERRSRISRTIA